MLISSAWRTLVLRFYGTPFRQLNLIFRYLSSVSYPSNTTTHSLFKEVNKKVGYPKSYPIVVWNYLPPSAGSIIHPHVQIIIEGNSLFLSRLFCINPPFIS